ncbi:hypothetical protein [Rhizobium sp. BE258]|uniref:hypothetical protein n=1 Tax=Rhizobium sp. BE258 TaxID=2817722 RepID=UPI002864E001|nr:hypothetical protein [Rhizobium sp. BE258]MDR7143348.1 hypothetical protein [Rhizobium sp. BE258]
MSAMLSRYLKDFSDIKPVAPAPEASDFAEEAFGGFADFAEEPAVDLEAERRSAYAEGYAAATSGLSKTHADQLQAAELGYQRQLDELKEKYEQELAVLLAARLSGIAFEVAELVSAAAAKAIAPVVTEAVAEQAVADLAVLLKEAILDGAAGVVIVKGPANLFASLEKALGEKSGLLRHIETDDVDLIVEVDGSVLVTRISAWSASLKKVLE